jgi:hypothetical protein
MSSDCGDGVSEKREIVLEQNVRAARIVRGHKGYRTTGFMGIAILAVSKYPL